MSRKILRRCTLCKKFHAAYLVQDPKMGKLDLCYSCWKARQTPEAAHTLREAQRDGHRIRHPARDEN